MHVGPLGVTGLTVSRLGLGGGHLGGPELDERQAGLLLHAAVDMGVSFIDAARSYGLAEERIGRHLAGRRSSVLSSKCGYGIEGIADWTGACIASGVEAALAKLSTDRVDVMHLHSCDVAMLQRQDVQRAMEDTQRAGKVLVWAAGHAPWRFGQGPVGHYCETYWERLQQLDLGPAGLGWDELALRFAAFAPGVSTAIVGTSGLVPGARAVETIERGPLLGDTVQGVRRHLRAAAPGGPVGCERCLGDRLGFE